MSQDDGQGSFFSRWSKRKALVQQGGATVPSSAVPADLDTAGSMPVAQAAAPTRAAKEGSGLVPVTAESAGPGGPAAVAADSSSHATPGVEPVPRPTLQDVEQLDAQSDYRHFVARDVDPDVRNAAFKKLFHSDPHFNVMDGLDVYIDDYNTPNPLPVAIMKTLVQARALGLIDDELKEQDPPPQGAVPSTDESGVGNMPSDDANPGEPSQGVNGDASKATPSDEPSPGHEDSIGADHQPARVELVMVPDTASNDEPVRSTPAMATAEGTVVPFPRRPGSADPV